MSLVLDAGALIALGRSDRQTAAVIAVARQDGRGVTVPAGVVGQVWRGGGRQARLARLLNAQDVTVESLTDAGARAAGVLCGVAQTSDVIDATVVSPPASTGQPCSRPSEPISKHSIRRFRSWTADQGR